MKKRFIFPLLIALGCAACREDESQDCPPGLPCATQEGANTFGCYVNGEPWVAELENSFTPTLRSVGANYNESNFDPQRFSGMLIFNGRRNIRPTDDLISITLRPVYGPVTINQNTKLNTPELLCLVGPYSWYMDTILPYKFEITRLDTDLNICSGRFSFFALNSNKDTLKVTDGRFDIRYQSY